MDIRQDLTSVNRTVGRKDIKYIVIHYTGNTTDTAAGNANYFRSVNRGASAHYFVDNKEVVQVVKDSDTAWAVGKNYGSNNLFNTVKNNNSISIEMCSVNRAIANTTFYKTVELTKELMKKYNISSDHVYRHYDVCTKNCPGWKGWTKSDDSLWKKFKNSLVSDTTINTKIEVGTVQLYTVNKSNAQKWVKEKNTDGTVSFKNVATGLYLDVTGASKTAGAIIQVYTHNTSAAQKFKIEGDTITSALDKNLCVDVYGASKTNGSKIQTWKKNGSGAQKFKFTDCGNDTIIIINTNSNKALDVTGGVACGSNSNYSKPETSTTTTVKTQSTSSNNSKTHLKDLQKALNDDYKVNLVVDGLYGPKTDSALSKVALSTKTLNKYINVTAWVQARIGTKADGKFGNNTKEAVKSYQKKKGLLVDGIVGKLTIKAILKDMGLNC